MKKLTTKIPRIILGILVLLFSLGQLQKLSFSFGNIFIHDLVIGLVLGGTFLSSDSFRQFVRQRMARLPAVAKIFGAWIVIGLGLAAFHGLTQASAVFYLVRLLSYGLFGWWLEYQVLHKKLTQRFILQAFVVAGGLIAYFGWLQYFFLPDTRFLFWLGWDDHYYRLISTLLDPAFTGLILVLSMVIVMRLLSIRRRKVYIAAFAFLFAALLFTYSRSSYLSFGVVVLGLSAWQVSLKNWKQAVIGLLAIPMVVLAVALLPNATGEGNNLARTSTITARQSAAEAVWQQVTKGNWLVGNGVFVTPKSTLNAEYAVANHALIADNWLLFLLQGTGVVGTSLALGWLFLTLWRHRQTNPFLVIGTLAILSHAFFNASLVYPFVVLWALSFRFMGFEIIREKK